MKYVLVAIVVVAIMVLGWNAIRADSYYRGVYESCVRTSFVANRTTSFDLLACSELEQRARREKM